jgi:hypothetical protein
MLMLTPRVLGTSCCVLLLQVLCSMKKLLSGVKRVLSSGLSSRGSGSCSGDNGLQDSPQSSSFMPSPHGTAVSSRYLAHDDVSEAMDGDDISIRTTEEMEKYESSAVESLVTLVSTMWACLRGLVWTKSFHHPPDHRLGKTL